MSEHVTGNRKHLCSCCCCLRLVEHLALEMSVFMSETHKRVRQLTEKAMAVYEEKVVNLHGTLKKAWDTVEKKIQKNVSAESDGY